MTDKSTTSSGPGLPSILFVVFLVLKLTDVINWSWWWVTSPLWISAIFYAVLVFLAAWVISGKEEKRSRRGF